MTEQLVYTLAEAAEAARTSIATIRRAIATSDPHSYPPPLRAKRQGLGPKAKQVVLAGELRRWIAALPDA